MDLTRYLCFLLLSSNLSATSTPILLHTACKSLNIITYMIIIGLLEYVKETVKKYMVKYKLA